MHEEGADERELLGGQQKRAPKVKSDETADANG